LEEEVGKRAGGLWTFFYVPRHLPRVKFCINPPFDLPDRINSGTVVPAPDKAAISGRG
jgi:hypothetical protein